MIFIFVLLILLQGSIAKKIPSACYREGEIALTFDQGPSYYSGILLNILKKENIKAAFHVTPDYLDNPVIMAYLRRASQDNHIIGLYVKANVMDKEGEAMGYIQKMTAKLQPHIGQKIRFLRFAHPGPSAPLLQKVIAAGYIVTGYNLDSNDFSFKETGKEGAIDNVLNVFRVILDSIVAPAKGSFVTVQRDLLDYSVTATEKVIKYAKSKGYLFVRLDQCISPQTINSPTNLDNVDNLIVDSDGSVNVVQNNAKRRIELCLFVFLSVLVMFLSNLQ